MANKLNRQNLKEAVNLLKEIDEVYSKINIKNPFDGAKAKDYVNNIQTLKDALDDAKDVIHDMDGGVNELFKSFQAITNEVGVKNKALNTSRKHFSSLTSVVEQLKDHQKGITNLSSKELKSLTQKLNSSQDNLRLSQEALKTEIKDLETKSKIDKLGKADLSRLSQLKKMHENVFHLLQDKDSVLKSTSKKLIEEEKLTKSIERKTGILGGVLKGISKIPILGDIFDANEALKASKDAIRKNEGAVSGLGAAFKNIGGQITKGILNPANLLLVAITTLIKVLIEGDKATGEMAKSLNLSYQEANNLRGELTSMVKTSEYTAINTRRLQESLTEINKAFGTTAKVSKENLETFSLLRDTAGMTNEEIISLYGFSKLTGKELKDSTESFQASAKAAAFQSKVAINTKKLMADISKVSRRTQLSIEGGEAGLAKAMVNAKLMGVELNKVADIASSLLDFEQSIEAELEAELLLGKNINLEKARQAALNNDLATVAKEIQKQAGSAAEFNKMNRIQQEAMAKAVGMTADGLADALFEQEALASLGKQLNDEEKKAFEKAKDRYGVEEATKMIKEGQLDQLVSQQSTAEKLQDVIMKVQEIFVAMTEPILGLVDGIMNMVGGAKNLSIILTTIASIYGVIKATQMAFNAQQKISLMLGKQQKAITMSEAIASIVKGSWSSVGIIPVVGAALAAAAIGAGIAALYSATKKGDDIMSEGGYGKRTLFGPEGAIQLNDEDTVIAGTNLFGGDKKQEKPTPQPQQQPQQASVDMTQTNALLQQLISVIQTGGQVILDGEKVGQALKLGTYQVQ